MSRFIIFLIGIIAGWFLKDSNWEERLEKLKAYVEPRKTSQKPISLLEEQSIKATPEQEDEVFADPLEKIKGIGPAIKKKLNESGIYTFAQLGALSSQDLEEIVGPGIKRFTDEDAIINAAKEYAK